MSPGQAIHILREMVRREAITVHGTVFRYEPFGHPSTVADIKECFITVVDHIGDRPVRGLKGWRSSSGTVLDFWCDEALFAILFDQLYVKQKLYPVTKPDSGQGPLPTLFIGAEKTQIRQIPLAEERPWPFKFLLELGGMIVCRIDEHAHVDPKRDLLLELRQYLNNFPHFRIKVHAEQWPTGEILIVTTWFQTLQRSEARQNVNV